MDCWWLLTSSSVCATNLPKKRKSNGGANPPDNHQHGWGLHLKSERVPRLLAASIPMRVSADLLSKKQTILTSNVWSQKKRDGFYSTP